MKTVKNIKRNEIDYLLTDILPMELSILFSYRYFYDFLLEKANYKIIIAILKDLSKCKNYQKKRTMFEEAWDSEPLKFNILKANNQSREINIMQPLSALNVFYFINLYQKEIINLLEKKSCFSLRFHKKNNQLEYKQKSKQITEYFSRSFSDSDVVAIIKQNSTYFKLSKYRSLPEFTSSNTLQMCNFKYKQFAKIDYKSCFHSIYTHCYKWILARNTTDSKKMKNANLFIVIDRLLQNINGKSSHGVIVGPEFSRMIAELLLQEIDVQVRNNLLLDNLRNGHEYVIYRFVDDVFIFADSDIIIHKIIDLHKKIAQKFLLQINELKINIGTTPLIDNAWIVDAKRLSDEISDLFYIRKDLIDVQDKILYKEKTYFPANAFKNIFKNIIIGNEKKTRFIVSYIMSTLFNCVNLKAEGFKIFQQSKTNRKAFAFIEYVFYIFAHHPSYDNTQKLVAIIEYCSDDLEFKNNRTNLCDFIKLIEKYSFIFERASLNDIINLFLVLSEFKIELPTVVENKVFDKVNEIDNPILWAHLLIYSRYNKAKLEETKKQIQDIINEKMLHIGEKKFLYKEFWYLIIFNNCDMLDENIIADMKNIIVTLLNAGIKPTERSTDLIARFMLSSNKEQFFNWNLVETNITRRQAYKTYQKSVFKKFSKQDTSVLYGSLD